MNAEIHILTGAYALDALSDTERAEFEQHLAGCAPCAAEVAELRATATRLGSAVALAPPPRLRQQVLAAIGQTRQVPPEPRRVTSAAESRILMPRWTLWLTSVAAAVSMIAAVAFGVRWASVDRELDDRNRQVAQAEQQLDQVLAVMSAPDARTTSATVGGSTATAIVSHSRGKVAFLARGMPELPSDRSYQLWLVGPSGMEPVGVLTPGADPAPVVADIAAAHTGIGVTVEPRGGSQQPSGEPVMEMPLPA